MTVTLLILSVDLTKFNSSLLNDIQYRDLVKDIIRRVVAQYGIIDNNENFYESVSQERLKEFYDAANPDLLQHIVLKINHQSFMDILLMEIRQGTMAYSVAKKKDRVSKELKISQEINVLEALLDACDDEIEYEAKIME